MPISPFISLGAKPNGPFGFVHTLGSVKREMAEQCDREYPALKSDVKQLEEKPGVIAYIFNTLINIEPLGYGTRKTTEVERSQMSGSPSYEHIPLKLGGSDQLNGEGQGI